MGDINWTRRDFIKGIGATTTGIALSSCAISGDRSAKGLTEEALAVQPVIRSQDLEKPDLTIGYVPVNDCAPFAIAWKKGFFRKYGLNVKLNREASWATSRDGLIFGRLDASPVVSGAVTNARIGAEGARHAPLCAAMTIHRHGNAMTMNKAMWDFGLRPWYEYQEKYGDGALEAFGRDFRGYFDKQPPEGKVWAVVLSSAIYEYFVRYLSAAAGVDPLKEFRVIIVPPPQMVTNVRIGAMQAYMVAEPWNTRAITGNENIGFTFAQGKEVWLGHPDRLLGVMESFIDKYPKTYCSLVKAMIEACQYCSKVENRQEVAELLTERSFTGARPKKKDAPIAKFTSPGILGNYNYGGFDGKDRTIKASDTTIFFDIPDNLPKQPEEHSTFLWRSRSLWLMTQAARWGQIHKFPKNAEKIAEKGWRTDLYREIANEMGIKCPKDDYKVEPPEVFIDKKGFDPSDPVGYLNSFTIRANAPIRTFYVLNFNLNYRPWQFEIFDAILSQSKIPNCLMSKFFGSILMMEYTSLPLNTQTEVLSRPGFLEIENLVKSYPTPDKDNFVVLDGVNLTIGEDEYISVIGHSGCGKSTLLKIVAGLEKATSGSVRLDGKEIRQPGAERMMVFQNYSLLPWLTVRENIRLAVDEVLKNANRSEKISIVNQHLAMVNLTAAADKYPDEISGGMKQRVGIARALAIRPKMLLMDEPFGALDALTRGKLQRQVLDIWENNRQAVMMITHDVDEAIYMSDRIVLMTNGPSASIGEILEVPFEHPRDRAAMRNSKEYFELRNHALNFLDRYFAQDE